MSIPTTQKVYQISKHEGIENLVQTTDSVPRPKRGQVLVKIHATSLNFRDLMVASGQYPGNFPKNLVPLSDGAGEIVEVGEDVTEFKTGDKVAGTFFENWIDGPIIQNAMGAALGGSSHGMLAQYRVFDKTGVVKIPSFFTYEEAATLPCAAVTAWNALACGPNPIRPGQSVLVLGTGGVSVFAIQFASAAGARVIVTSSSDSKLQKAKDLGASDLINYSQNPNWEEKVLELTDGKGVDHVVEVGGSGTAEKSLKSVKHGGYVHMIGVLTRPNPNSDIAMSVLMGAVNLRGVLVGSRGMFESMNRAIEVNKIHPVIDKVFDFDKAQDAYKYLQSQQHVGKVVIKVE